MRSGLHGVRDALILLRPLRMPHFTMTLPQGLD